MPGIGLCRFDGTGASGRYQNFGLTEKFSFIKMKGI